MKYENPNLSDAKIAKLITNKHPEFKYDDPEQIRQKLRAAQQEFMDWCWEEARDHAAEFAADLTADRDDLYD